VADSALYPVIPSVQAGLTGLSYLTASKIYIGISGALSICEGLAFMFTRPIFKKKTLTLLVLLKLCLLTASYVFLSLKINLSNRSSVISYTIESAPGKLIKPIVSSTNFGITSYTLTQGAVLLQPLVLTMPKNITYKLHAEQHSDVLKNEKILVRDDWFVEKVGNISNSLQYFTEETGINYLGDVIKLRNSQEDLTCFVGETDRGRRIFMGSFHEKFKELNFYDMMSSSDKYRHAKILNARDIVFTDIDVKEDFSIIIDPMSRNLLTSWPPIFPLEYHWLNETNDAFLSPSFFGREAISSVRFTKTGNLYTQETKTVFDTSGIELYAKVKASLVWILLMFNFIPLVFTLVQERKNRLQVFLDTLPFFTLQQGLTLIESEAKLIILFSMGWFSLHYCSVLPYADRFFTSKVRFSHIIRMAEEEDSCLRQAILRVLQGSDPGFKVNFETQHISLGKCKLSRKFFIMYLINAFEYKLTFLKLISYSFLDETYDVKLNPAGFPKSMIYLLKDGITHRLYSKQGYIRNFVDFESAIICYSPKKPVFLGNLRKYGLLQKYGYEKLCKTVAYVLSNTRKGLPAWMVHKNTAVYNLDFTIPVVKETTWVSATSQTGPQVPKTVTLQGNKTVIHLTLDRSYIEKEKIKTKEISTTCGELTINSSQLYSKEGRTKVLKERLNIKGPVKLLRGCCTKCLGTPASKKLISELQAIKQFTVSGRRCAHSDRCSQVLVKARETLKKVPTLKSCELRNMVISEATPKKSLGNHSPLDKILLISNTDDRLKKIAEKGLSSSSLKSKKGRKYCLFPAFKESTRVVQHVTTSSTFTESTTSEANLVNVRSLDELKEHMRATTEKYGRNILPDFRLIQTRDVYYHYDGTNLKRKTRKGYVAVTEAEFNRALAS